MKLIEVNLLLLEHLTHFQKIHQFFNSLNREILDSSILFILPDFEINEIICNHIFRIQNDKFQKEISKLIEDILKLSNLLYNQKKLKKE